MGDHCVSCTKDTLWDLVLIEIAPGVVICEECIQVCHEIVAEKKLEETCSSQT